MQNIIIYTQIVISALLITLILLQRRDSDVSGFMGGSSGGNSGFYQQRRGVEKFIFVTTIVLVIAFTALALASVFYHEPLAETEGAPLIDVDAATTAPVTITPTTTTQ